MPVSDYLEENRGEYMIGMKIVLQNMLCALSNDGVKFGSTGGLGGAQTIFGFFKLKFSYSWVTDVTPPLTSRLASA